EDLRAQRMRREGPVKASRARELECGEAEVGVVRDREVAPGADVRHGRGVKSQHTEHFNGRSSERGLRGRLDHSRRIIRVQSGAMSRTHRRISEWLFVLTFAAYAYFHGGGGWNQSSQLDLTRAIAERHTFAIDAYIGNSGDVAFKGGHIYSNKSPAL